MWVRPLWQSITHNSSAEWGCAGCILCSLPAVSVMLPHNAVRVLRTFQGSRAVLQCELIAHT